MTKHQRTVLEALLAGRTPEEIEQLTGMTKHAVLAEIRRTLRQLRKPEPRSSQVEQLSEKVETAARLVESESRAIVRDIGHVRGRAQPPGQPGNDHAVPDRPHVPDGEDPAPRCPNHGRKKPPYVGVQK